MNELYNEGYEQGRLDYNECIPFINKEEYDTEYVNGYVDGWTDAMIEDKQIDVSTPIEVLDNLKKRL